MSEVSTIERAFELARTGLCKNVEEIRVKLKRERCEHVDSHLSSGALRQQLKDECLKAAAVPTKP